MTPDSPTSRQTPAPRASALLTPLACAVAVSLFLVAGACAAADGSADNAVRFSEGWQEHTRPLIFHGSRMEGGQTLWMVPATLPKGNYRVITLVDGQPRLVDGQRFTVTSDVFREVHLVISNSEHSPEAIDERWVILPGQPAAAH